jgi:biopolymer transport protein ExbD
MARKRGASAADLSQAEEMDLTPMIDVTFLLIVFFLCVTEMSDASKEKLDLPLAEKAVEDMHEPGRLIINVTEKGDIYINHVKYDTQSLQEQLETERKLSWSTEEQAPTRAILIRVDEKTKFVDVYKVMYQCMQKQLWKIAFAAKTVQFE